MQKYVDVCPIGQFSLSEYKQNLKAFQFRINKLCTKTFLGLFQIQQEKNCFARMEYFWKVWKRVRLSDKISNNQKARFYKSLTIHHEVMIKKTEWKIQKMTADNFRQKQLKKNCFYAMLKEIDIRKKISQIQQSLKKKVFKRWRNYEDFRRYEQDEKQMVKNIYKQNFLRKMFQQFLVSIKFSKLRRHLLTNKFPLFMKKVKEYNRLSINIPRKFYQHNKIHKYFEKFKYIRKIYIAQKKYQSKLIIKHFQFWKAGVKILFYEKEEEHKIEQKLQHFLEEKQEIIQRRYFNSWKEIFQSKKETKYQNEVLKDYFKLKEKQYIYKKYFNLLKQFKYIRRAEQFYEIKLKQKAVQFLKKGVLQSAEKWVKIDDFIQKREKLQYFKKIIKFNKKQEQFIKRFRLRKIFNAFSIQITRNYFQLKKISERYHKNLLYFKAMFAIKSNLSIKNKTKRCIIMLHAKLPLKRWRKNHHVAQFVEERQGFLKGKIFYEIKYLRASKMIKEREIYYFQQSQETQILTLESPTKMFSLDYSISKQNSQQILNRNF